MWGEIFDRALDGRDCPHRRNGIRIAMKLKGALDVFQSARRIDYRRHGFGRAGASPLASLVIQACTSSAP